MNKITFSIIIPTYNAGRTLSNALDSVFKQKNENFEVIIIDGKSNDNTLLIAESYRNRIICLSICSEPDNGIYHAMNKGIKRAQGEWIYFLGADDAFTDPFVLDKISKCLDSGIDVFYGNVWSNRFGGRYGGQFNVEKIYHKNICHQSIFFHKGIFEKTGVFDLKYAGEADWDHNMKWMLNRKIKKKYLEIDIAHYADGGFSSIHGDHVFQHDKRINFIRYAFSAPASRFIRIKCKIEFVSGLRSKSFGLMVLSLKCYLKNIIRLG